MRGCRTTAAMSLSAGRRRKEFGEEKSYILYAASVLLMVRNAGSERRLIRLPNEENFSMMENRYVKCAL